MNLDYSPKTPFSDIILVSDNKEFYAHKIILCQNSSYLAALITGHDVANQNEKPRLQIEFSPNLTKLFLDIIYKSDSIGLILDIIPLADKYNVPSIKIKCLEFIDKIEHVNKQNINILINYVKYTFVREKLINLFVPYLIDEPDIHKIKIVLSNNLKNPQLDEVYNNKWMLETIKNNYNNIDIGFINFPIFKELWNTRADEMEQSTLTQKWIRESSTDQCQTVVEFYIEKIPIMHIMEIIPIHFTDIDIRNRLMLCLREHLKVIIKNMKDLTF